MDPVVSDVNWLHAGFSGMQGQYLMPFKAKKEYINCLQPFSSSSTQETLFFDPSERVSAKDEERRRAMKADFMALWAQLLVSPQTREQERGPRWCK